MPKLRRTSQYCNRGYMSRHETPMILDYWKQVGGTLIEEFQMVKGGPSVGRAGQMR